MFRSILCVAVFLLSVNSLRSQPPTSPEFKSLTNEMTNSWAKSEWDRALKAAEQLYVITAKESGKDSPAAGVALRNRAMIAEAKGDQKLASASYDQAVEIFKRHRSSLTPAQKSVFADVLEGLGRIRSKQDFVWSERIFKEALEIRESIGGPDSIGTVSPLVQLASIAFWTRDFKRSVEIYDRAIQTLSKAPKTSTEDIALVYYRTQCSYRRAKIEDQFVKYKPLHQKFVGTSAAGVTRETYAAASLLDMEIVNGKATHLQKPEWPPDGKELMNDGKVLVDVLIDERGNVISACSRASERNPIMLEASEIAAYKSKFQPPTIGGQPVKGFGTIEYTWVVKY